MFGKGKDRKITMDERLKREKEIKEIRKAQKTFFMGGRTREVAFRIVALKRLKTDIMKKQDKIYEALNPASILLLEESI